MIPPAAPGALRPWVLPVSMCLGSFAWSFVYVSLPFHILHMSTLDATATLRWSGWILGITPLVTVVTAPLWGRAAGQVSPKGLYVLIELLQGVGFLFMALARTLPELLLSRMVLGIMGAASTFAFIIAGRTEGDIRRPVSHIQSAMTVGQVIGPLAGAIVAARIGFRQSFVVGAVILWGCSFLVWRRVPAQAPVGPDVRRATPASLADVATVCLVVLSGSTHIFFLTAILPQILPPLGVAPARTLEVGGLVIFASGAAAALGAIAAPRLSELASEARAVPWLLAGSAVLVAAFAAAPEVWSFGTLRFLQVLLIAPVFPLAVAGIAQRASGQAIGFVNSARIGAAFLGPVIATTLLALGGPSLGPSLVYLALAAIGLTPLPVLRWRGTGRS